MKATTLYRQISRDLGPLAALDSFESVIDVGVAELHHDALGCRDCWNQEERRFDYCPRSRYNVEHPYHTCLEPRLCRCRRRVAN